MWREYLFATSVADALEKLCSHAGDARLIAGGTDLVLQSERGQCPCGVMVDISRVPGLNDIEERDGHIVLGALVTFAQLTASRLILKKASVLAEASAHVGGPQIRNSATLVGNVVNAQPAADGAVALFALGAELEIAEIGRQYWVPIDKVYRGVGDCTIDATCQMVTAVRFKLPDWPYGCGFQRLAPRKALTLPSLVVACTTKIHRGVIESARIAVGPVAPTPYRASTAERYLAGQPATTEVAAQAGELAALHAEPRNSPIRGSREYRIAMTSVLVKRALIQAFACG